MPNSVVDPHALIMAPMGRDASIAANLLREIGVNSRCVNDLPALVAALANNVVFVVLTDEVLLNIDLRPLGQWVQSQEAWSDLPFILLTRHGGGPERHPAVARISEALNNVSLIERPFHATTFASVAKTALKGRRRQYESRTIMEDLRESGDRLNTALVAGRLGAWELDIEHRKITASEAFKSIFGYAAGDTFGFSDFLATVHDHDRARVEGAIQNTIGSGNDLVSEFRTCRPDHSEHWAEIRARLVRSRRKIQLVGVASDITARKLSEARLRDQNETLEARVAERTLELEAAHRIALDQIAQREIAEEKLRQSQKMEMIGQLTGGVAHDFNNLLMAVLGNLDLLKKHSGSDARAIRLIDGALQGAQRGASLTQRLLAFARKQDLTLAVTDVSELVRGMIHLIERTIGRTIELRVDLPQTPARADIDVNQLELALLNIAVNARDAMPNGGILTIVVDVGQWSIDGPAKDYVRISVTDTGHGMDDATLKRAAEPFFSTKGVGKGTGLGLSMIQGLVEQLGGKFQLSSTVGVGTTAELLFPATAKPVAITEDSPAVDADTDAAPKRLRILMVDDDFLIAMSTVDMLMDLGHEVLEANSGEAALRILNEHADIDLMITDFSMPRMNGAQLALAARELRPDLPIILATGYAELPAGSEIELPRLGKPYDQRQLETQIDSLMAKV